MVRQDGWMVVTGGAGFIGSHLAEALLNQGHSVRVVDNLATGRRENLAGLGGDSFDYLAGDLTEFEVCRRAAEGAVCVFHHAAIPSVPRSIEQPLESHSSGPTATLNMLEAARLAGARRFIFAASSSAYGETETLPKHEDMLPSPLSPYAAAKLAGEHYVRVYARTMGLDGVSLRYFNIFGPRQDPSSPYSGVISRFIRVALEGRPLTIHGDGTQTRDFTYISNAVHANLLAMSAEHALGGEVINVGTGVQTSLLDVIRVLSDALGRPIHPEFTPARPGDIRHSQASLGRIEGLLSYHPLVNFEDGLRRTLHHAQQELARLKT